MPLEHVWVAVKDNYGDLEHFTSTVPERVGKVVDGQTSDLFRPIPKELARVEAEMAEQLRRARAVRKATRCGVAPEDPDFPRAVMLEEKLATCTARTARLQKACMAYCEEVQSCRARAQALLAKRDELAAMAREAMQRNRLVEAAAEPLSARDHAVSPAFWLTDLLPPPSRSRSRAGSRGSCRTPASARSRPSSQHSASRPQSKLRNVHSSCSTRSGGQTPTTLGGGGLDTARPTTAASSSETAANNGASLPPCGGAGAGAAVARAGSARLPLPRAAATPREPAGGRAFTGAAVGAAPAAERRWHDEIASLQARLREVRRTNRELGAKTAEAAGRTGRLEEFFLLCMHDFRQAGVRQRSVRSAAAAAGGGGGGGGGGGTAADAQASASVASASTPLEKVLRVMAESDELHMLLYEKLFPRRQAYFRSSGAIPAAAWTFNWAHNASSTSSGSGSAALGGGSCWEPACDFGGGTSLKEELSQAGTASDRHPSAHAAAAAAAAAAAGGLLVAAC